MLQRLTFNGGELAPELHWRSDLERYHTGCRELRNFVVTPYGGVRRRYPLRARACLGAAGGPRGTDEYRVLPFRYSEDTAYLVCLDAGEEQITIYSTTGTLKATVPNSPFLTNLYRIQVCQSNDVMWLFSPDLPTYRLERTADTSWALVEHQYKGGPWRPMNLDRAATMSIEPAVWASGTAYVVGDRVLVGDTQQTLTAIDWVYAYREQSMTGGYDAWFGFAIFETRNHYYTKFSMSDAAAFAVGNTVIISGTTYHNGTWTVVAVDTATDYVLLDCGVYKVGAAWYNKHTETLSETTKMTLATAGFYEAIADGTNHAPGSSPTYWRSCLAYSGPVTLRTQQDTFAATMVGGRIRLEIENADTFFADGFGATGEVSPAVPAYGTVRLTTDGGRWGGTLQLQQSTDGGATWEVIGSISSHNADYNGSIDRTIDVDGALVRAYMLEYTAPADNPTGCQWKIEILKQTAPTWVKITAYTDARTVTATTESWLFSVAQTWRWSEGAFSPRNGYPRAGCIFEERLVVGGTYRDPHVVWGSAINDWVNFAPGTLDTSPITFGLAADKLQTVQSLIPKENLMVLTDGGEWTMGPRDAQKATGGDNVKVRRHTEVGAAPIQAVAAAAGVFYVQRGRGAIRSLEYSYELDGFESQDVSIMARHLMTGGLRELAYQRSPWPTLWCVRDDGYLISFTYDRHQQVAGWAQHDTFGTDDDQGFLSVCCLPGDTGDVVWCLVQRMDYVYLEEMADPEEYDWEDDVDLQSFTSWLDWRFYTSNFSGEATTVTLLLAPSAVEACGLAVYGDGRLLDEDEWYLTQDIGSGGTGVWTVTTDEPYHRIDVGIPYDSVCKPTDPAADPKAGTSPGERVRVSEVDAFLVDAVGGEISADDGVTYVDLPWLEPDTIPQYPLEPQTARKKLKLTAGHTEGANLSILAAGAGPLTLAALTVRLEVTRE